MIRSTPGKFTSDSGIITIKKFYIIKKHSMEVTKYEKE